MADGSLKPGADGISAHEHAEMKERKRAAYVRASPEREDAEPAIGHQAFDLLQQINRGKR